MSLICDKAVSPKKKQKQQQQTKNFKKNNYKPMFYVSQINDWSDHPRPYETIPVRTRMVTLLISETTCC